MHPSRPATLAALAILLTSTLASLPVAEAQNPLFECQTLGGTGIQGGICRNVNFIDDTFEERTAFLRPKPGSGQEDQDRDGLGDNWTKQWEQQLNATIDALADLDLDGLRNVDEFRWEFNPVCIPTLITNCKDYDEDAWEDGAEVLYWDDTSNNNRPDDAVGAALVGGFAFYDED